MILELANGATAALAFKNANIQHERAKSATTCAVSTDLLEPRYGIRVTCGTSYCSKKDVYCAGTGRKGAFQRAIQNFSRFERALLWDAFAKADPVAMQAGKGCKFNPEPRV